MSYMNATHINVTGTKSALRKLAAAVGGEIQENARTGALFVAVPFVNANMTNSADARSDGSVAYRTIDGCNHLAETQAAFLSKCRGFVPGLQDNIQRHVGIVNGIICRL